MQCLKCSATGCVLWGANICGPCQAKIILEECIPDLVTRATVLGFSMPFRRHLRGIVSRYASVIAGEKIDLSDRRAEYGMRESLQSEAGPWLLRVHPLNGKAAIPICRLDTGEQADFLRYFWGTFVNTEVSVRAFSVPDNYDRDRILPRKRGQNNRKTLPVKLPANYSGTQ